MDSASPRRVTVRFGLSAPRRPRTGTPSHGPPTPAARGHLPVADTVASRRRPRRPSTERAARTGRAPSLGDSARRSVRRSIASLAAFLPRAVIVVGPPPCRPSRRSSPEALHECNVLFRRHRGAERRPRRLLRPHRVHLRGHRLRRRPRQHLALPGRRLRERRRRVHPAVPGRAADRRHPAALPRLRDRAPLARLRPRRLAPLQALDRVHRLVAGAHRPDHRAVLRADPGLGHELHDLLVRPALGR